MYFWNIWALKSDLRANQLTPKYDLKYLIAIIILTSLRNTPTDTSNGYDYLSLLLDLLMFMISTWYCFKINGGDTGQDFLRRYLSIFWVVGIRVLVCTVPISISVYSLIYITRGESSEETTLFDLLFILLFSGVYYWHVIAQIKDLKNTDVWEKQVRGAKSDNSN
ncbi:hypothetical protein [Pseudoalteromonas luteoviolacea]|uniref:Uncharacterized protein n=1 Tax=Pseudoalteromonas luteoviolacea NCIMB 1942 TaxID=1365253 RepID=A0A167GGF8_9GAMM|nr:hypothetical protein [Pseudoalteromonas luteoviolacea]KZN55265.1 hypothetical protein N482_24335 [Pseudoalteromonas luteoviolacea NCIMB 1942]KZW98926.1 hypothetical protein JL49_20340 [Pseudoalteromonas luteoviolacea]